MIAAGEQFILIQNGPFFKESHTEEASFLNFRHARLVCDKNSLS